jgi:hypothetical protein
LQVRPRLDVEPVARRGQAQQHRCHRSALVSVRLPPSHTLALARRDCRDPGAA